MTSGFADTQSDVAQRGAWRHLIVVFGVASLAFASVFAAADWYAGNVSLPRYCDDTAGTLGRVERILAEPRPAGDGARRPYIIAAKLLYLVPRAEAETRTAYLARLRQQIEQRCR